MHYTGRRRAGQRPRAGPGADRNSIEIRVLRFFAQYSPAPCVSITDGMDDEVAAMRPEDRETLAALDGRMDADPTGLTSEELGVYLELCTKRVAEVTAAMPAQAEALEMATAAG